MGSGRPTRSTHTLALIGFMGSGKSAVGGLVAERAGAPFCDLDSMIENEAGMTIPEIFATRSEAAFRALESRLLPEALRAGTVVALGGGTPVEESNWRLITQRAITVYLDVPFLTIWKRIGPTAHRPLAVRSRDELEALLDERRPHYEQAAHRVDNDRPLGVVADEVLKLWSA
ncbi:MAG TPA: shikimate kinase [Candidatus Dormibacteraeota bacterium]|nr:shikimate kinase [Candidatus Dormibacteraeota bacterium]